MHVIDETPTGKLVETPSPKAHAVGRDHRNAPANGAAKAAPRPRPGAETVVVTNGLGDLMGDAPPCSTCGHTTIRNGTCYKCLNCGTSMGCS